LSAELSNVRKSRYNETVKKCGHCGGRLRRIHRTWLERLSFMAKYRCRQCQSTETVPHPYRFHLGKRCRCHRCGTYRVTKLKARDKIDPMETGLLNLFEKIAGGGVYHCKFCRVQFWDRRKFAPVAKAAGAAEGAPRKAAQPAKPRASET
jgi:hydrogenase maturation factor HypF (carbamoyltransferase family)